MQGLLRSVSMGVLIARVSQCELTRQCNELPESVRWIKGVDGNNASRVYCLTSVARAEIGRQW